LISQEQDHGDCFYQVILSFVQVLAIDGNVVDEGWNGDRAAQFLRGTSGTSVRVRLARRSAGKVPGVASRPEVPLPVPHPSAHPSATIIHYDVERFGRSSTLYTCSNYCGTAQ